MTKVYRKLYAICEIIVLFYYVLMNQNLCSFQTGKTTFNKKNKRKNSTPKTTRKRKERPMSREEIQTDNDDDIERYPESITVHIPESQLVHLMPPSSKSGKVMYRREGATSVIVPIYINPPNIKSVMCPKCPAEFRSKEELQEHLTMHKKEFKCLLCNKGFYTSEGLLRHQDRESHSHPCEECDRVFPLAAHLKRHTKSHSTERSFLCDVCHKGYLSGTSLRSHKRNVHAVEKKHKCPECGKAFARKDKMKRHELIHFPDTRPTFPCPFRNHIGCMKTFYREDKLKRHLFTHSTEKPYKCDECQKTFARRDNLTDHMRLHSGLYDHTCHICNKGFLGPTKLKKHLKNAHGEDHVERAPPVEPSPTMVPREGPTTTNTVTALPAEAGTCRTSITTAATGNPESVAYQSNEENEDSAESGSSLDSDSNDEQEEPVSQHLPPISRLAPRILPCRSATPFVPPPANTNLASRVVSSPSTVSEMMGLCTELHPMVRTINTFSYPQGF